MPLQSALFSGISGLTTYADVISVVGNNIANANTPGFKESRARFTDILAQSSGGGDVAVGRGVVMRGVDRLFSQGAFQSTSQVTDLAIDGEGFFVVKDPATQGVLYTRTGDFEVNATGDLVTRQGGEVLQGIDLTPTTPAPISLPFLQDINLNGLASPPKTTANATVTVNLDANATAPGVAFAPATATTYNFTTALSVFDSLGASHTAELYFQKQAAANTWNWYAVADVSDLTGAGLPASGKVTIASGDMTFTTAGVLDTTRTLNRYNYAAGTLPALVPTEQGANVVYDFSGDPTLSQTIAFDFGTTQQLWNGAAFAANPAAATASGASSQFQATSGTLFQSQDGFSSGILQGFSVDPTGIVKGTFSNGQTRNLFQIGLAKFPNPGGLEQAGNSLFSAAPDAGEPVLAAPKSTGLGAVVSNALEISNVDLSTQFVELIRAQQAYQANARVITTGSDLMQEALNLSR